MTEIRNGKVGTVEKSGTHRVEKRKSITFGVTLSVLIHAIGLWLIIDRNPLEVKPPAPGREPIVVSLESGKDETPMQSNPAIARPKSSPQSARPAVTAKKAPPKARQSREPVIASNTKPAAAPKTMPQPEAPQREMSAPDDMFSQLEAARKRRADANAAAQAAMPSVQENESQRANSVALANIAHSLKGANGNHRDNSGGIFQIRRVGFRDAEFMFHGWSANARRNSTRLVTVEQGAEADIEIAVVKKMIAIIREEKSDTFIWESHRLGKQLTLSARHEDEAELQRFLIREFFPDYTPSARTGENRSDHG